MGTNKNPIAGAPAHATDIASARSASKNNGNLSFVGAGDRSPGRSIITCLDPAGIGSSMADKPARSSTDQWHQRLREAADALGMRDQAILCASLVVRFDASDVFGFEDVGTQDDR